MAGVMWLGRGQWGLLGGRCGWPVAGRDGRPAAGDAVWAGLQAETVGVRDRAQAAGGEGTSSGPMGRVGLACAAGSEGTRSEPAGRVGHAGATDNEGSRWEPEGRIGHACGAGSAGKRWEPAGWIANAGAADAARLTADERLRRLRRAGIPTAPPGGEGAGTGAMRDAPILRFRIAVLGLEAVEVRSPGPERFGIRRALDAAHPLYRLLERTAVKAAYALGAELALVEAATDGACAWVQDARPADPAAMTGRELELWSGALARAAAGYAAAAEAAAGPLLLGADPEFVLLREDGRIASAARYFPLRGEAGCDTVRIGGRLRRPLAELRPAPAAGPAELLARLRGLLRRADRTAAPGLRWLAGAMPVPGLPLGGHVHLSGAPVTVRLLRALDSVAALPFALAADPRGDRRRPRYGALGDFRRQAHGGFEYRTLPSWLVSPTAAAGALSLALLAAREAYRGLPPVLPAEREAAVEAFYAGDRTALRGMLDEICGMIAATASYAELSRWIDPFLEAVRSGRTWDETADIRGKWRIGAGSARRRASMPRG